MIYTTGDLARVTRVIWSTENNFDTLSLNFKFITARGGRDGGNSQKFTKAVILNPKIGKNVEKKRMSF